MRHVTYEYVMSHMDTSRDTPERAQSPIGLSICDIIIQHGQSKIAISMVIRMRHISCDNVILHMNTSRDTRERAQSPIGSFICDI